MPHLCKSFTGIQSEKNRCLYVWLVQKTILVCFQWAKNLPLPEYVPDNTKNHKKSATLYAFWNGFISIIVSLGYTCAKHIWVHLHVCATFLVCVLQRKLYYINPACLQIKLYEVLMSFLCRGLTGIIRNTETHPVDLLSLAALSLFVFAPGKYSSVMVYYSTASLPSLRLVTGKINSLKFYWLRATEK